MCKWLDYHRLHQEEHIDYQNETCEKIGKWDSTFLDEEDHDTLFSLLLLSNYLEIKDLLGLCCKYIARQIIGKTVEEVEEIFKIKTPVESGGEENNNQ